MLKRYRCQCGNAVFFRNSVCLACGTPLGFDTALGLLIPLQQSFINSETSSSLIWQQFHSCYGEDIDDGTHAPVADASANVYGAVSANFSAQVNADENACLTAGSVNDSASSDVIKTRGNCVVRYRRCANLHTPAACNWLINAEKPVGQIYCIACSLNRVIPDLTDIEHPENKLFWGRVELAKRRMLAGLIGLGLSIVSKVENLENGLAFDLVNTLQGGKAVMTGHDSGVITLNLQEADDATRESIRTSMGEPYRTLLGHFRHETGHYFWDRLVKNTHWIEDFRRLFGDESQDYAMSLQSNYDAGPPKSWWLNYVSSYASSHPWEDWAETWAHYLHMCDTLDTASSFGLTVNSQLLEFTPFSADALYDTADEETSNVFLHFINVWAGLTVLLNEMSRSMGQPDFYPFVLPNAVVTKLHFVHLVIQSGKSASRVVQINPSIT